MSFFSKKFFVLFSLLALLAPFFTFADGLVPCGGPGEDICTLCHFIIGINGFILWVRNIATLFAIAGITIAGAMYVISAGTSLKEQAKKFITASLIGFLVIQSAWLMVSVTIWLLAVKTDLGIGVVKWNTFTCDKTTSTKGSTAPNSTAGASSSTTPSSFACAPTNNGCGELEVVVSETSPDVCNFTSPELAQKLACLKGKNVGAKITSITVSKSDWCEKCVNSYVGSDYCIHAKNSCHFGGQNCKGTSQAADIDSANNEPVAKAAVECGFDTVYFNNKEWVSGKTDLSIGHTKHIHASVNNAKCGCK